jgi:hypothetical protein
VPHWLAIIAALLTLPGIIILGYFPLMTDLFSQVGRCFHTSFTIYNFLILIGSFCFMFNDVRNWYIVVGMGVSAGWTLFVDAIPGPIRRSMTVLALGFGFIWMVCLQASLVLELATLKEFSFSVGVLNFNATSHASSAIINLSLFFAKNCFSAIHAPGNFTVIVAKVNSKRKTRRLISARSISNAHVASNTLMHRIKNRMVEM